VTILETKKVTKVFGGLVAVDEVSISVEEGEIMGLIGPNGAGKTTLMNAIAGLDPPTSGSIYLFGEETTGYPPEVMCHKGLARTFQIPQPFPKMTSLENVMIASIFGDKHRVIDPVSHSRQQLEFVGFPLPEDTLCEHLNTVQLKRLDLSRALATSPRILLLDELASGLSEAELHLMINIIRKIREKGITILIIEHIMHVIMEVCDRLAVLQFGKKIAEGTFEEVSRNEELREAYLGK
jgi:branched-chain amino acid transport system ATP-binding protein